jgi:PAS domain S-box-containing protein
MANRPTDPPFHDNPSPKDKPEIALGLDFPGAGMRGWPLGYGLALLAVAVAATLRYVLGGFFGPQFPFSTFYPAVMFAAVIGGQGVGIFATLLSAACADYLFFEPYGEFGIKTTADLAGLLLFSFMGVCISMLAGVVDRTRKRAEVRLRALLQATPDAVIAANAQGRIVLKTDQEMLVLSAIRDTTSRAEAEAELRESEERFRRVFEEGPIGLALVGADYHFLKVNSALCRMVGYSEPELLALTFADITHPDDLQADVKLAEQLFRNEIPFYQMEKRYFTKSGEVIWIHLTGSVIRDHEGRILYALAMVEDITKRRQAEEELRLSSQIITNMGESVILVRASDGVIVHANPKFERMFGYGPGEITGSHVATINAPAEKNPEETAREIMAELRRNGLWAGEVPNRKKDGTAFWTAATVSTFDHPEFGEVWISIHQDITERKRGEESLQRSEEELRLATEAANIGVWQWDIASNAVYWSDQAKALFGLPTAEQLTYSTFLSTVHSDDRAWVDREVAAAVAGHVEFNHEYRVVWPDQSVHWIAARGAALYNRAGKPMRMTGVVLDVTRRKEGEVQLKLLNERISLATRVAAIGIWDWDLRTNLTVWDDTLFEMHGIPKLVPMPYDYFSRLVHPEDRPKVEASLQRAIHLKTQDYVEFRIIRPDGVLRYISSAEGVVLDENGKVIRVVGIGVDITERKRMEAQLEASARLSALGMMAGGIAHEINNPLMVIHASASDLLDMAKQEPQVPAEPVMRMATRIRQTSDRIARIVKSLRRIAREGSKDQFFPVAVSKIVEETLEICRERFRANSISLHLPTVDPRLLISCREVQIAQVLLNLLQNAFDAVVDQQADRWVRLDVTMRGNWVVFSVIDSGPGVPPSLKARIMEPFFTTKEVGKGTGLGLSLSAAIAEEHSGKLELSEEDGHTCFSFSLPLSGKAESICS